MTDDLDTMFELAREGEDVAGEIERDIKTYAEFWSAWKRPCCSPAKTTRAAPSSPSTPAPAAPKARTGPRCCCACTCAGPSGDGFQTVITDRLEGEGRGHQVGHLRSQRRERVRAAAIGNRRAPPGAHFAVRRQRAAAHLVRLGVRLPAGGRRDQDRHQAGRSAHRHVPLLGRRRPARQHDRFGGAHHALSDRTSWCSARTSARSTRTATAP